MLLKLLEVNSADKNKNPENLYECLYWEPIHISIFIYCLVLSYLEQKFHLKCNTVLSLFPINPVFVRKYKISLTMHSFQFLFFFLANCKGEKKKSGGGNGTFCVFIIDGYESAKRLCDLYYMSSPELILEELNGKWLWEEALLNVVMASSKVAGGEMFSFHFSYSCLLS